MTHDVESPFSSSVSFLFLQFSSFSRQVNLQKTRFGKSFYLDPKLVRNVEKKKPRHSVFERNTLNDSKKTGHWLALFSCLPSKNNTLYFLKIECLYFSQKCKQQDILKLFFFLFDVPEIVLQSSWVSLFHFCPQSFDKQQNTYLLNSVSDQQVLQNSLGFPYNPLVLNIIREAILCKLDFSIIDLKKKKKQ